LAFLILKFLTRRKNEKGEKYIFMKKKIGKNIFDAIFAKNFFANKIFFPEKNSS